MLYVIAFYQLIGKYREVFEKNFIALYKKDFRKNVETVKNLAGGQRPMLKRKAVVVAEGKSVCSSVVLTGAETIDLFAALHTLRQVLITWK